jgi:DNA-binding IclR family transcriptional regulator
LMTRGYASRMPNRRFTLGARSLRLVSGWIDRLLQIADAPMRRIADGCGETVYLLQLVGSEAVTLARLSGGRRALVEGEIGPSYPLWAAAAGRALLGTLAAAGRAIPRLHPENQEDLVRSLCGDAGRPTQRHSRRGRRDKLAA